MSTLLLKAGVYLLVWTIATVIAFLTQKTTSFSEPFIVGTGITLIIFFALRLMKVYDKIFKNAGKAGQIEKSDRAKKPQATVEKRIPDDELSISQKQKIEAFKNQFKHNLLGNWEALGLSLSRDGPGTRGYMFFSDGKGEHVYYGAYGPEADKGSKFIWKKDKEHSILLKNEKAKKWIRIKYDFGFLKSVYNKDIVLFMYDEKGRLIDECVQYHYVL